MPSSKKPNVDEVNGASAPTSTMNFSTPHESATKASEDGEETTDRENNGKSVVGDTLPTEKKDQRLRSSSEKKRDSVVAEKLKPAKSALKKKSPKSKSERQKKKTHLSSSSDDDSEDGDKAKAAKSRNRKSSTQGKAKRKSKASARAKADTPSSTDDSSSSSSSEDERARKKRSTKSKKPAQRPKSDQRREKRTSAAAHSASCSSDEDGSCSEDEVEDPKQDTFAVPAFSDPLSEHAYAQMLALRVSSANFPQSSTGADPESESPTRERKSKGGRKAKGSKAEFYRLDNVWSKREHRFITQPSSTSRDEAGQYEAYAFNVVRHFDYQNKYTNSLLNICSEHLKEALLRIMGKVGGVSLEENTPKIDPNMCFLHLSELKDYAKNLKKKEKEVKRKRPNKVKQRELFRTKRKHVEVLIKYLDQDYDDVKKSLEPLVKSGKITFELLWALFKSNEIIYTNTYGHEEMPRAAKVGYVSKSKSIMQGEIYNIETQFLDFDSKRYGMAEMELEIKAFKGVKRITNLPIFPLKYHPDAANLRKGLIERGKKFTSLGGMHFKQQHGMAYVKKDNKVVKVHVNGRVMLDPATFRRMRPNYQFSSIRPPDPDILPDSPSCSSSEPSSSDEADTDSVSETDDMQEPTKKQMKKRMKDHKKYWKKKVFSDSEEEDGYFVGHVHVSDPENDPKLKDLEHAETQVEEAENDDQQHFTDEEYLIASPVVLGFSFGEKMWLEFSVSGIKDIEWNEGAFESLIVPDDQKTVVRALVESHSLESEALKKKEKGLGDGKESNIDDVIKGKGRGLVCVLHGPPGTGKTLTAEGIADLLRKPLYSVSVGELGTSPTHLERNLNSILDMAHTWGSLLLLDEADVFLEERTNYDVGRNALVSIFLRLLEYFQGILFLTTNRVSVFDPAFASRIHVGLRFGKLEIKTRKKIWRVFLDKAKNLQDGGMEDLREDDMSKLSQFELNGREIKNAVRTAQSVALVNKETLGMKHLLQVLLVGNVFAKDLKGAGYEDALKFYM